MLCLKRERTPDNGKKPQAKRIHELTACDHALGELVYRPAVHKREAEHEDDDEVFPALHPEKRAPIEQHVADGAAAERYDDRERIGADEIEILLGGRDHCRKSAEDNGDDFKDHDG